MSRRSARRFTDVAEGFTAVKLGYGSSGKDVRKDVEPAKAAREAAGGEVEVMIDIGQAHLLKRAIQAAREFEDLGIFWMEEPLRELPPIVRFHLLRNCCGRTGRGALDFSPADLRRRPRRNSTGYLGRGGLTEAKRIAYMAHEANRLCVRMRSGLASLVAVCLHLFAAIPNSASLEFSVTESPLRRRLLTAPFKVVNSAQPGLEINPETVET